MKSGCTTLPRDKSPDDIPCEPLDSAMPGLFIYVSPQILYV